MIIAGWLRTMGAKSLGHPTIPADVYEDISEEEAYNLNAIDNAHLELTPMERARQVTFLRDKLGYSVEKIAGILGVNTQHVYDLLGLLELDWDIRRCVESSELTLYQAVEIGKYPASKRLETLRKTVESGASVSWLKRERKALTTHPFYNYYGEGRPAAPRGVWHAVRLPRGIPEVDNYMTSMWKMFLKRSGVPAPWKCEFTTLEQALKCNPPYVCHEDVEWVVFASGNFHPPELKSCWDDVPLEQRAGWFYLCDRCTHLLFPNCEFHEDKVFSVLLNNLGVYGEEVFLQWIKDN